MKAFDNDEVREYQVTMTLKATPKQVFGISCPEQASLNLSYGDYTVKLPLSGISFEVKES